MEYHKDQFGFVDQMAYLRASLVIQAAHQWLIRYCARRETSGTIVDCAAWTDREWGIATNGQLKRRDVQGVVDAGLASWASVDLVVHGYDVLGERECLRERQRLREYRNRRKGPDGPTTPTEIIRVPDDDKSESRTQARTASRTRTVRVRDADQSSPDQSSPDHTPPNPPMGVGDLASQGDDDAKLTAVLDSLGVASGPEANRRWLAQVRRNRQAVTFDDQLRALRYAVRRAREVRGQVYPDGRATVNYASDVREFVTGWAPQAPQAEHTGAAP